MRPIDTAVILAAGMGARLQEVVSDRPKGFLELQGGAMVERSIRQLQSVGVESIIIVTGHRAEYYEELAARLAGVVTLRNERYATSGSMYSLYVARHLLDRPFLLLESDLIYETRALDELIACPGDDVILLSGATGAGDEVYVDADGGRVRCISKRRSDLESVTGELVGITKATPAMLAVMAAYVRANLPGAAMLDYEACISAVADRYRVGCHVVRDLVWTEIDDPQHLLRAQRLILPRLEAVCAGRARAQASCDGGTPA